MVIGVEGNVHVGKTTYINKSIKDYNVISESVFNPNLNSYERQLDYIRQEIDKKKKLKDNTILDRTIISIIIYTMNTDTLNKVEKRTIISKIKEIIKNNEIIIPTYIHLIIYPYKLLSNNHFSLKEQKKTQDSLVDYDYYLKYSLFFANRIKYFDKIIKYDNYREIISYDGKIFDSITRNISLNSKVLIDYSNYEYKGNNDLNNIVRKINLLNGRNKILDNSFLMDIICLLHLSSKKKKVEIIDEIMSKSCLNNYVTKIIYINSKKKDYVVDFYKTLDARLGVMSNIRFVSSLDDKIINDIEDKPLMLIDLFYEIKEGIMEGEL